MTAWEFPSGTTPAAAWAALLPITKRPLVLFIRPRVMAAGHRESFWQGLMRVLRLICKYDK